MKTRTRKIWRDITSRKVRTFLTSLSIFIGVFGVVALSSAGQILVNQLEKDIQTDKLSMFQASVILNPETASGSSDEAFATMRTQSGVTLVEGRAVYPLYWRLADEKRFRENNIVSHSEPFEESQIEPTRVIEGRYPVTTGSQDTIEIAIEQRFANEFDLGLDDEIVLRVLTGTQGDEIKTATGKIVGIIFQAYGYTASSGEITFPDSLVFADFADASYVGGFQGYTSIYARFENFATAQAEKTAFSRLIASTGYIPTYTTTQDPDKNPQIESTRRTNNLLILLAISALVVSGFLIVNVVNSIVIEQRRQIGQLKIIGATGFDIFYIYVGTAFVYGLLGVIPGVLLGLPASYLFAKGLAAQSQTIISDFVVSPVGLILGIGMGLGVPMLAAVIPVINGVRISSYAALTDMGIDARFGNSRIERVIGRLPLPFSLRQATRNAYQKRVRLVLTGITLTLASAAFMGIFAVFTGLVTLVSNAFNTYGYEILVVPNTAADFETVKALLETNIEAVDVVDPATSLAIEIEGYEPPPVQAGPPGLFALGVNTENPEILKLDLQDGVDWRDNPTRDGIILSGQLATDLGKGVGDEIVMIAGGNRQPFTIMGIAQFPGSTVWMSWEDLARLGGVVNTAGDPYPNSYSVTLDNGDLSGRQVDDVISEINDEMLANGISSSYSNNVAIAELINTIVAGAGIILSMAAFLIALVGAVGLLTTLSLSVFERQKEIGVMRSVGATSFSIAAQFLAEGLIVGLVAWAIAAPMSYGISLVLLKALPFGGDFDITYSPWALVVGLAGMVFVVSVASLLPSLAAARRTVSDILRYQ